MFHKQPVAYLLLMCGLSLFFTSCYRKTIDLQGDSPNSYTGIVRIDTVEPILSTVLLDSFATNSNTKFYMGRYVDPYTGTITAKPFFQVNMPTSIPDISDDAVYDSLVFMLKLSKYYYGDTTISQTVIVNELAQGLDYSYNDKLYNTSSFAIKPTPLGSKTQKIRPSVDDTVVVRLSDAKGLELFAKLKERSGEFDNSDRFLQYFKGVQLAFAGTDNSGIYGISDSASIVKMRLHYHTTFPAKEELYIDFPRVTNDFAFTQILSDRSATLLPNGMSGTLSGMQEVPSESTANIAYTQSGTGILMKATFPSLKGILQREGVTTLLKAEFFVRPVPQSYGISVYTLPSHLYLAQTSSTNLIGSALYDSTGSSVMYEAPVIDYLYGRDTYYRFNVSSYINTLLFSSSVQTDQGFFILQENPTNATVIDRGVFGNAKYGTPTTTNKVQLVLHVLTVNK
ncbi:MAG: DUF4270 family protein [Chitinophagaceae bacterium]